MTYDDALHRGEDTVFYNQYAAIRKIMPLRQRPELFVRTYHGGNTSGLEHHLRMRKKFAVSVEQVRSHRELIHNALKKLDIPGPIEVCGNAGSAFIYE